MSDVLSQEEMNKLLNTIEGGEGEMPDQQEKIKFYNFRRPEVFTESQHNTLSFLHEQLAQTLSTSLTELFQIHTAFHVSGVCELTYEEFLRSIPNPCFLSTISMSPLPYNSVLEIDPQLITTIIDLLAGGDNSNPESNNNREISELDIILLKDFLPIVTTPFNEMWNTKIAMHPIFEKIDSNPLKVKITSNQAMIILVTIESLIGQTEGMVNICYPVNFIRIPFMGDKIKKVKGIQPEKKKLQNIMCKKYNQFRIGNFPLKAVKNFKTKQEMIMDKETLCSQKFTPVIHDREV